MIHSTQQIIEFPKMHKEFFEKEFGVTSIGLFGSFARGEAREDSYIDIAVELYKERVADNYFGLLHYLEDNLHRKIDLGIESNLKTVIKKLSKRTSYMSKQTDLLFLNEIINSTEAVESFVNGLVYDTFVNDRKSYSATLRELEVIGEAAGKLSDDVKIAYPNVDWRTLKDFRNVLAHAYFGVNPEIVWDIVQNKLSGLNELVSELIEQQEKSE